MLTKEAITTIKEYLQKHFPKIFPETGVLTLKKGIQHNISESGIIEIINISKTQLGKFMTYYTRSTKYLKAHKVEASRYDLEGNVLGEVTVEEADYAKNIITKREEKFKALQISKNNNNKKNIKNVTNIKSADSVSKYTGTLTINFPKNKA